MKYNKIFLVAILFGVVSAGQFAAEAGVLNAFKKCWSATEDADECMTLTFSDSSYTTLTESNASLSIFPPTNDESTSNCSPLSSQVLKLEQSQSYDFEKILVSSSKKSPALTDKVVAQSFESYLSMLTAKKLSPYECIAWRPHYKHVLIMN